MLLGFLSQIHSIYPVLRLMRLFPLQQLQIMRLARRQVLEEQLFFMELCHQLAKGALILGVMEPRPQRGLARPGWRGFPHI